MKFKILQVDEKIQIEVTKGNNVLMTKEFDVEISLEKIKEVLKSDVALLEVKEKEKERKENKKNEFKKLIGKEIEL